MSTHLRPAAGWWNRHEYLMWTVSRAVERRNWIVRVGLFLFFVAVS